MRRSRKSQETVELLDPQLQQFDWTISAGLIALLAFLPAAMGTHEAWNEAIALYVAIATVFVLGVKLIVRADQRFSWSWTYLPIVALVAYIGFQLVPLPLGVLRVISPGTVADRLKLLADLPARFQQNRFPLSFYSHNTWHDLRNLLATIAVFVVTVNVSRSVPIVKLLLWGMAIIVSGEALLALVQDLTGASGIYWSFPLPGNLLPNGGTFPNHNFFAQFINVGSGATLGLLLLTIDQTFHRHDYTPAEMIEKFTSSKFRAAYFLIVMLSLNAASVLLSLSRGGVLAMVASGAMTVVLLVLRGGRRGMGVAGWFAGLAVLFIFILVLAGGAELVESRLHRLASREDRFDRYRLTTDTLKMWRHYPLTGTGFGTYEYVFPRFDTAHIEITATHAEDEYAELLAELGIAGGACVVCFGAMIGWAFFRARDRSKRTDDLKSRDGEIAPHAGQRRRSGTSVTSSISIGIGFGLMAMLVQSVSDFAPHFLSVSMPAAVLCGLMLNLAFIRQRERASAEPDPEFSPSAAVLLRRRIVRVIGLTAVMGLSAVLIIQAEHAWSSETAWYQVDAAQKLVSAAGWKDVEGEASDMNRYATDAIRADPQNVFRHFWRAVYQSYALDPSLAPVDRTRTIELLNDDLQASRMQCPTFGPMLCQIGQWQQNDLGRWADGAAAIRLGVWLSPNDSTTNFVAGGCTRMRDTGIRRWRHFRTRSPCSTESSPKSWMWCSTSTTVRKPCSRWLRRILLTCG